MKKFEKSEVLIMKCSCGGEIVRIAESWTDENGYRYVSYRCTKCGNIVKVRI